MYIYIMLSDHPAQGSYDQLASYCHLSALEICLCKCGEPAWITQSAQEQIIQAVGRGGGGGEVGFSKMILEQDCSLGGSSGTAQPHLAPNGLVLDVTG